MAPFWSANVSTVTAGLPAFLHFTLCASASVCSVVPFSTATVWPQMSAMLLIDVPPDALVKNDSPTLA